MSWTVFYEPPINFLPTYKFDVGTNEYDSSEKKRAPAWTDRIFYRSLDKNFAVNALRYASHSDYLTSDHKPISGTFSVAMRRIVRDKYTKVHATIIRELDKMRKRVCPDVALSAVSVDFGTVKYKEPATRTITIQNTGQVIAQYQFIPKLQDESVSKPWLQLSTLSGTIIPGESAEVSIIITVQESTAFELMSGKEALDEILILHLENGKDYFISICGQYQEL